VTTAGPLTVNCD